MSWHWPFKEQIGGRELLEERRADRIEGYLASVGYVEALEHGVHPAREWTSNPPPSWWGGVYLEGPEYMPKLRTIVVTDAYCPMCGYMSLERSDWPGSIRSRLCCVHCDYMSAWSDGWKAFEVQKA